MRIDYWNVLGNYRSANPERETVRTQLLEILQTHQLVCDDIEVRSPGYQPKWNGPYGQPLDWHQDDKGAHLILGLWTNTQPSLYRRIGTCTIWRPRCGDLVLVNNSAVEHRPTLEPIRSNRIFARAWNVRPR